MSELRYPNETQEYREARDALLEEEKLLIENVKALAAKRRALPPGGELAHDYTFVGADDRTLGDPITFSELFGDKETLLIYSYMFGPDWDHPCPSCTSLIDGFDRASISVTASTAFVVVAKAGPQRLNDWAKRRDWTNIALVSAEANSYLTDYKCQDEGPVAVLEPHGFHSGGPPRPAPAAAEFPLGVPREALSVGGVAVACRCWPR